MSQKPRITYRSPIKSTINQSTKKYVRFCWQIPQPEGFVRKKKTNSSKIFGFLTFIYTQLLDVYGTRYFTFATFIAQMKDTRRASNEVQLFEIRSVQPFKWMTCPLKLVLFQFLADTPIDARFHKSFSSVENVEDLKKGN